MKSLKFWLGLAISAALIWWAFAQVDINQLGRALAETNYLWLALCLPVFYLQFAIRALRWAYLLQPIKRVPYKSLIASTVIGFTGNTVLPARLGEIIRAIDLGRRENISTASSLATIFLERVFDGLVIVPLFVGTGWLLGIFQADTELARLSAAAALIFSLVWLACLVAVVLVAAIPRQIETLTNAVCRPLPDKVAGIICGLQQSLTEGLMMVRSPLLLVKTAAYSVVLWLLLASPIYLLAYGVGYPISITAAIFTHGTICLAVAVPSSPGFVGTMHAAAQIALVTAAGMPPEQALALALVYHGGNFVFTILYCLKFLIRGDVSFWDLSRAAQKRGRD